MDYERIHTAMEVLNWRWGMGNQAAVPSVSDLQACVESLSNSAREHPGSRIMSGGFEACYTNGHLRVAFVLGEIETDDTVIPAEQTPEVALGD
jgi:hypothetical protein